MKNLSLPMLIFIATSFISKINGQDKGFNTYYFNDYTTYYSLGKLTSDNEILVYDKNRQIDKDELKYVYGDNTVLKTIQIVHSLPTKKNYLLLSDYIINENLAVISFATSDHKKYIIFTLKRKNSKDKWNIISIHNGTMN